MSINEINDLQERPLLNSGQVCQMLGISRQTLSNWVKAGRIRRIELRKGMYRYDETSIYDMLGRSTPRKYGTVIYARMSRAARHGRVSGGIITESLEKQVKRMNQWCVNNGLKVSKTYTDKSSSTVWNTHLRGGFHELLRDVINRNVKQVIVESPDRIGVFSYKLVRELFTYYGTRIIFTTKMAMDEDSISDINLEFTESVQHMKELSTGIINKE
jgi:predicted site-specific integrase-resolvase